MNYRQMYNARLKRVFAIEKAINNNPNRYDELYPTFNELTLELSKMKIIFKEKYNYIMSDKEILNGFEGVN